MHEAAGAGRAADRNRHRLILAVDDARENLFLVQKLAEAAGYTFFGASSGLNCLSVTLRCVPHLILLDVEMPEMSGYETCRRLRRNPALARVPIAFLTARKTVEDVTEGLAAGGNDFIIKPFQRGQLLERLQHWTSRQV